MADLFHKYLQFVRAVSVNRIGLTGVVLTTTAVVLFVVFELGGLIGLFRNAYAGLITYLAFPVIFVIGLILIPIGWRKRKRDTGKSAKELLEERFPDTQVRPGFFGSHVFRTIVILTLGNIVIIGLASSRMLSFMDEPNFCGTACHSVMNPEWVTYQASPHARVKCVECHVGEGIGALIDSKINGTWQMISVTFDLLERPIPTPVHQLRPARETCEKCHWPDKFYGNRLQTLVRYERDSASTPKYTSLNMKIDAGTGGLREGIHWHIAEDNTVRYASVEDERKQMIWVEAEQDDGSFRRFVNRDLVGEEEHEYVREVDCIDCHNRATHIYEDPSKALDERIDKGVLPRSLPYLKREALAAVTTNWSDSAAAMDGIRNHIEGFYRRRFPEVLTANMTVVDSVVTVLRSVYNRNIHHEMNIDWNAYPSLIGHRDQTQGCFRCHNPSLVDSSGAAIRSDCTLCHSILAFGDDQPLQYLQPPDTADPRVEMHRYLRQEFFDHMER